MIACCLALLADLSVGQTFQRNFSLIMKCPLVLTLSCLAGVREWQLSDVVLCALHHDVRPHTTNVGARPAGMAASGRLSAPPARQHDRLVSWDGSSDASSDAGGGESWDGSSDCEVESSIGLCFANCRRWRAVGGGHSGRRSTLQRPSSCCMVHEGGGDQWHSVACNSYRVSLSACSVRRAVQPRWQLAALTLPQLSCHTLPPCYRLHAHLSAPCMPAGATACMPHLAMLACWHHCLHERQLSPCLPADP
eukprot:scaffold169276_cov23-Tisochrysis_lutea.AAC.2